MFSQRNNCCCSMQVHHRVPRQSWLQCHTVHNYNDAHPAESAHSRIEDYRVSIGGEIRLVKLLVVSRILRTPEPAQMLERRTRS